MPVFISTGHSLEFPVILFLIWRPPALPHRLQCSTIGRSGLNRRVRDGYGCFPWTHRHQKFRVTKVSAQSRDKGGESLLSWALISQIVYATQSRLRDSCPEVHLRPTSLLRNFYQGYLIDSIKLHVCSFQGTYLGLNTQDPMGLSDFCPMAYVS